MLSLHYKMARLGQFTHELVEGGVFVLGRLLAKAHPSIGEWREINSDGCKSSLAMYLFAAEVVQLHHHSGHVSRSERPRRLTITWWGCCGLCLGYKQAEFAHSFLISSCVCFCLYGPFNCISFHKFS